MLRAHEEIRFNWLRANGELFAGTVEASTTKQQDSNGELAIVCVSAFRTLMRWKSRMHSADYLNQNPPIDLAKEAIKILIGSGGAD